jgi:hypothetical protein
VKSVRFTHHLLDHWDEQRDGDSIYMIPAEQNGVKRVRRSRKSQTKKNLTFVCYLDGSHPLISKLVEFGIRVAHG